MVSPRRTQFCTLRVRVHSLITAPGHFEPLGDYSSSRPGPAMRSQLASAQSAESGSAPASPQALTRLSSIGRHGDTVRVCIQIHGRARWYHKSLRRGYVMGEETNLSKETPAKTKNSSPLKILSESDFRTHRLETLLYESCIVLVLVYRTVRVQYACSRIIPRQGPYDRHIMRHGERILARCSMTQWKNEHQVAVIVQSQPRINIPLSVLTLIPMDVWRRRCL